MPPIEKPPPLGHRVPNTSHAVSVQMPTWHDMCGMALGDPRVKKAQKNGYPRSFIHHEIEQLSNFRIKDKIELLEDYACLVYPNRRSAAACHEFLLSSPSEDMVDRLIVSLHDLQFFEKIEAAKIDIVLRRLYAVAFPKSMLSRAMIFWRLTGTGISSRFAAHCLRNASSLRRLEQHGINNGQWQQSWTNSHQIICRRIVDLLRRASLEPLRAAKIAIHDVFLYQTGMSAIYHIHQLLLRLKDAQSIVFGFPYELTLKMLQTFGPGCTFYPFGSDEEIDQLELFLNDQASKGHSPQALWCECPSNPLLRTPNLRKLRSLADRHGLIIVVDDTIGTFANIDLLGIADIIITSLTKSFSGYSNVMAGSAILNPAGQYYRQLSTSLRRTWSNDLYSEDALQLEINSRDFLQRVNQINNSTSKLVQYFESFRLTSRSNLTAVYYPEICWSAENYRTQMRRQTPDFVPGYGGVFTLEFSTVNAAAAFFDACNVHKGPSLGANLTLMQPYVQTVFFKEKEWAAKNGVKETIVRVSVGLEDPKLLLESFQPAMAEVGGITSNVKVNNDDQSIGTTGRPFRSVL